MNPNQPNNDHKLDTPNPPTRKLDVTELDKSIDEIVLKPATWQLDYYVEAKAKLKALLVEVRINELEKARAKTKPHMTLYLPQPYKQAALPDEYLIKRIAELTNTEGGSDGK